MAFEDRSASRGSSQPGRNSSSQRGSSSKPFRGGRGRGSGGRGRGRGNDDRQKGDMGRAEWSKTKSDRRTINTETQATKRQKLDNGDDGALPIYATKFDEADIAAEERKPKKKVAVMLGYSGTGYKGMQLAPDQKTIEGDIFKALVEAGAISKANADDPKKSSFVRCARTDKGVHAAGNIISLKLITEDEDLVKKINAALTPQIRIWGYERTNNGFSCYQLCDSRIYEYLIPTHSFLPPHPRSFLGKKCKIWAEKKGDREQWEARQEEVKDYWENIDETVIKPILDEYPEDIRAVLQKALWMSAENDAKVQGDVTDKTSGKSKKKTPTITARETDSKMEAAETDLSLEIKSEIKVEEGPLLTDAVVPSEMTAPDASSPSKIVKAEAQDASVKTESRSNQGIDSKPGIVPNEDTPMTEEEERLAIEAKEKRKARRQLIDEAVRRLRAAYVGAKRAYRIPETRKQRLQSVLDLYVGTKNYWNYTVQKTYRDPSAKRVMKSFKVNFDPILINGTEWLSLKVHGQSFMMHQIRKMVGMAALVVRCGCDPSKIIPESYGPVNVSIPKAPSLGLLLERPVFDSYNKRARGELSKEVIDFDKYKDEMEKFKQEFIYDRMYRDEERENVFGNFFNHVDNFPSNTFLFVTSGGLEASGEADGPETGATVKQENRSDVDEDSDGDGEEKVDPQANLLDSDDELDEVKDNAGDEG